MEDLDERQANDTRRVSQEGGGHKVCRPIVEGLTLIDEGNNLSPAGNEKHDEPSGSRQEPVQSLHHGFSDCDVIANLKETGDPGIHQYASRDDDRLVDGRLDLATKKRRGELARWKSGAEDVER